MCRLATPGILVPALLTLAVGFVAPDVHAGPFDKVKKKVEAKAGKKVDEKTDDAVGTGVEKATGKGSGVEGSAAESSEAAGGPEGAKGSSGGSVSSVSTKFDFVPGDSVLFLDDFTQDELGEFPARWRPTQGTFETAEMAGERWLRCVSPDGSIRMKMPATLSLPEFWTLEFDFYDEAGASSALTVRGVGTGDRTAWEVVFPQGTSMAYRSGELYGTTPYEGAGTVAGRHHIMFLARGKALKAYVDRQRTVNIPEIADLAGTPLGLEFRLWAPDKPMITNVRFAEGCRPAKDLLGEGKLVTYGIHFETGSDVVQPESAPILRQIAAYLESKPEVKLRITGHTDNVGKPAANLDLSKRRAAAVANVLSSQLKIAVDRFQTDGKGDTEPISSNAKPEGRAMNRRVEFAKLEG
jgi:hypothetical protein